MTLLTAGRDSQPALGPSSAILQIQLFFLLQLGPLVVAVETEAPTQSSASPTTVSLVSCALSIFPQERTDRTFIFRHHQQGSEVYALWLRSTSLCLS